MRTDTLIEILARDAGPATRALAARRLAPAALVGFLASAAVAVAILGAIPAVYQIATKAIAASGQCRE